MNFDDFKTLTEEEQKTYFESLEATNTAHEDTETQLSSAEHDIEEMQQSVNDLKEELRKTKELNFSLARKVNTAVDRRTPEEILNQMFS